MQLITYKIVVKIVFLHSFIYLIGDLRLVNPRVLAWQKVTPAVAWDTVVSQNKLMYFWSKMNIFSKKKTILET